MTGKDDDIMNVDEEFLNVFYFEDCAYHALKVVVAFFDLTGMTRHSYKPLGFTAEVLSIAYYYVHPDLMVACLHLQF